MQDINSDYESWNKKRLAIGILTLLIFLSLVLGVRSFFLGKNNDLFTKKTSGVEEKVKGVFEQQKDSGSEENNVGVSIPGSSDIQQRLEVIKKEVNSINITEITSSSPQIQKVLTDLKNLEEYPKNQVKEACYNICKGL